LKKNIKIITLIAAAIWHIGIIILLQIKDTDQPKITFTELLKISESELLEYLDKKLEKMSKKEKKELPYREWSKKIRFLKKEREREGN